MNTTGEPSVIVEHDDLQVVAEAMMLRLQLRSTEARRIARMRELLAAATELSRALSSHTHHALVHCQGSHGTWDLERDTAALFDALSAYGALVHDVALEYRPIARGSVDPMMELGGASDHVARRVVA